MKRNSVVGAVVVVAAMFAGQAAYVRPLAISPTGARAMFKNKAVTFKITNGTGAQLTVKAGKNTLILEPGKSTDFTLASGDEVVAKTHTRQYDEAQVLVT